MKKKLGIIIAILLCVALVFTFVACGPKPDKTGNDPKPDTKGSIPGVTATQEAEMETSISAYLDKWLLANAQEQVQDQTAVLTAALNKVKADQFSFTDKDMNEVAPTIQVTFNATTKKYTVVFSWNKNAVKQTFEKDAKTVTYKNWAGSMNDTTGYTAMTEEGEAAGAIDKIVNAALSTANLVAVNAPTMKYGVDTKIGIEVMGVKGDLHVKGNVDMTDASKTQLALLIETGDKVLGGLYYQGAAEDKDCKLILQIGEKFRYIDYAALNTLLGKIGVAPGQKLGEAPLPTGTLAQVLSHYGVNGTVASTVASLVDMLAQGYEKEVVGGMAYIIDINLSTVLSQVSELAGDLVTPDMFEGIPYLEKLDVATMHGLLGHITIAATLTGAELSELVDFELAVNLPECTFYLAESETDPQGKIDIPSISFAIFINDFKFTTTDTIENVIPAAAANAEYFSPTNFTLGGDIYINNTDLKLDDTFRFKLVSSVNPFKPSQAKASLTIKKNAGASYNADTAKNFLTITYEQSNKTLCMSGTVLDDEGTAIYTYDFDEGLAPIKAWLGLDNWQGIKLDENGVITLKEGENAKPAMEALLNNKLAKAILKYYSARKAEKNRVAEGGEDAVDSSNEGGFSINKIGDYINGFKAIYEDLVKSGVIDIDAEAGSAKIEVTPEVINKVTAAINALELIPMQLPTDIKEPKEVKAYFNTEDYKDKLYITVTVEDNKYELTFDGSQEGKFTVSFVMTTDTRIYNATATGTNSDFTFTYKVTDKAGDVKSSTTVRFSGFSGNWGAKNDDQLELYTADQIAAAGAIFEDNGVATNFVKAVIRFLNKDSVEPTAEILGKWIVDTFLA